MEILLAKLHHSNSTLMGLKMGNDIFLVSELFREVEYDKPSLIPPQFFAFL